MNLSAPPPPGVAFLLGVTGSPATLEGVMALPGDDLAVLAGVFLPISKEEDAGLLPRVIVPKRPEIFIYEL